MDVLVERYGLDVPDVDDERRLQPARVGLYVGELRQPRAGSAPLPALLVARTSPSTPCPGVFQLSPSRPWGAPVQRATLIPCR